MSGRCTKAAGGNHRWVYHEDEGQRFERRRKKVNGKFTIVVVILTKRVCNKCGKVDHAKR